MQVRYPVMPKERSREVRKQIRRVFLDVWILSVSVTSRMLRMSTTVTLAWHSICSSRVQLTKRSKNICCGLWIEWVWTEAERITGRSSMPCAR